MVASGCVMTSAWTNASIALPAHLLKAQTSSLQQITNRTQTLLEVLTCVTASKQWRAGSSLMLPNLCALARSGAHPERQLPAGGPHGQSRQPRPERHLRCDHLHRVPEASTAHLNPKPQPHGVATLLTGTFLVADTSHEHSLFAHFKLAYLSWTRRLLLHTNAQMHKCMQLESACKTISR